MLFRNSIRLLMENFKGVYKILLYKIVVGLIVMALCSALILPEAIELAKSEPVQELLAGIKEFFHAFVSADKAMLENTGKPMMVSAVLTGSEHAVRDWKKILEKSALDENDVICLRDLQGERINEMGGLIAAVYEAAQQTGCSKLWAVISLCDGETPNTLALSSVIRSMRIAAPYVDKIGGDSYSAHFCPDMKRTQEHHEQYLSYLNGGDKGE